MCTSCKIGYYFDSLGICVTWDSSKITTACPNRTKSTVSTGTTETSTTLTTNGSTKTVTTCTTTTSNSN